MNLDLPYWTKKNLKEFNEDVVFLQTCIFVMLEYLLAENFIARVLCMRAAPWLGKIVVRNIRKIALSKFRFIRKFYSNKKINWNLFL